jgi:ornithine--oxo-acid transaminase
MTLVERSSSRELIELEDRFGAHNYHPLDVVLSRGEGIWVWDVDGNRYMDCLSAYSAVNQGHAHPRILRALVEQAERLPLTSRAFRNDQLGPYYRELCDLTGFEMVVPMNTGAEAVETALKAARKWAYDVKGVPDGQAEIIACDGNFAGRTISIISFSSEPLYRAGFGPYTPGFTLVPYGDADALEAAITPNTAAFILEPIQGEAGVILPPTGYLREVRELCSRHNVLLIADEIQTGLGRTGRLFACDHEDVRPDIVTIGKALSGGFYPVSAALSSAEILGVFGPGSHGSTFGGSPLACAVAREALRVLVDEHMIGNAAAVGDYFMVRLAEIASPHVREVRGRGLLIGVELRQDAGGARRFCEALQRAGILAKETHVDTIRLAPPLVITKDDVDWAMERIGPVLFMR